VVVLLLPLFSEMDDGKFDHKVVAVEAVASRRQRQWRRWRRWSIETGGSGV
jgi:hypothetical protein